MLIDVPVHFRHPGELFGPAASLRPQMVPDDTDVSHPPTRLSSKFEAIGRGRNLHIEETADGGWIITPDLARDTGSSGGQ